VAVPEVVCTADPAEAAVVAVVRGLLVRHPEVTYITVVRTELDAAVDAVVAG
jgi:hypothetical protein